MTEPAELRAALRDLLDAGDAVVAGVGRRSVRASATDLADQLARRPEFAAADRAAERAAVANDYGTRERRRGRTAGRPLTADGLVSTGVAGWLVTGPTGLRANTDEVVEALAGYLAGPAVDSWRYLGIDAHIVGPFRSQQVADWELVVLDTPELRALLPVPPTADLAPNRPFDPATWKGTAFLRRVDTDGKVITGPVIYLPRPFPERAATLAMLILSCWDQDEVVTVWSDHSIEPGRHVGVRLDRVWCNVYGDDEQYEIPHTSSLGITPSNEDRFRRHCGELTALLPNAGGDKAEGKRSRRLRLAAQRFLAAGEHGVEDPTPYDLERQPDAVFNYVVTLEGLVAGDRTDGALARTVAQRTALLAGGDDAERSRVLELVRSAYAARSSWAHGDEPRFLPGIAELRGVVQRVLLAWLALGPTHGNPELLGAACDDALVSDRARRVLRSPVEALRHRIDG